MQTSSKKIKERRIVNQNIWLADKSDEQNPIPQKLDYKVLETEAAVGQAMFDELVSYADEKNGRHRDDFARRTRSAGDV